MAWRAGLVVVLAVVGAAALWRVGGAPPAAQRAAGEPAPRSAGARIESVPVEPVAAVAAASSDKDGGAARAERAAPPPGLDAAQWAALQADLASRPDGAPELQRITEYLHWSHAWQRWLDERAAGTPAAQLTADAVAVQAGLGDRLARREVGAAEARQIQAMLLEAIEPDPQQRARRMQAFDGALAGRTTPADPRAAEFQRRQAGLVAARHAAGGEPAEADAALASALESLRREVWAGPPAASAQSAPGAR